MLLGPGSPTPRPVAMTTLATALLGLAGAAPAAAQSGGAAAAPTASAQPAITSILCRTGCTSGMTVARGGTISLRGLALDRATAVVFLGARGAKDDARVAISSRSATRVDVRVPAGARSGRVAIVGPAGSAARPGGASLNVVKAATADLPAIDEPPAPTLAPVKGIAQLDAGISKRRVGRSGVSAVTVAYVSRAASQTSVRVDVVRRADGASVFSDERTVGGEQQQSLTWNGRGDGALAVDGKYDVRISAGGTTVPRATTFAAAGGAAPQAAPPPPGSTSLGAFTFVGAVSRCGGRTTTARARPASAPAAAATRTRART